MCIIKIMNKNQTNNLNFNKKGGIISLTTPPKPINDAQIWGLLYILIKSPKLIIDAQIRRLFYV